MIIILFFREVHDTINRLKEKHKIIMDELIDFLHEYYPPHPVDVRLYYININYIILFIYSSFLNRV